MALRIMVGALSGSPYGAIIIENDNKYSYCERSIVFQYIDMWFYEEQKERISMQGFLEREFVWG